VDRHQVLCLRFEDLQDTCTLSYTKAQLVEVTKAMAGKPNFKHYFPDGPKKATAIPIDYAFLNACKNKSKVTVEVPFSFLTMDHFQK